MAGKALDMKIEGGQRIAGVISREGTETFRAVDPTSGSDLPELFHEAAPGGRAGGPRLVDGAPAYSKPAV